MEQQQPRWYSVNSFGMTEWLIISCGFSMLLLASRMLVTGSIEYCFLPWNLFLAFLPYAITSSLFYKVELIEKPPALIALLLLWLLLFPNCFYIMTDLFHFRHINSAPRWFDLLLIFSFAWNGICLGILSLRKVEFIFSIAAGKKYSFIFVIAVMELAALGIFIGRYLRFNSWDILTDPFRLAGEITLLLIHPLRNGYAWGMTVCYAGFLTLLYMVIKKLGEQQDTAIA
jgi:uncharacterized membrane protein